MKKELLKYYRDQDKKFPMLSRYGRNLNVQYLTGKLEPCYYRQMQIAQIQKILLRRNKANALLTGVPGCGKTAIVEGLAAAITERRLVYEKATMEAKKAAAAAAEDPAALKDLPLMPEKPIGYDWVIYEISINAMVSGTKYRGDFEERVQALVDECKGHPNLILFVDEFHMVCTAGRAEGCYSASQILKPALARGDIRLIGATTTDEKAMIMEDGAFARRFSEVVVQELTGEAALKTARQILGNYCKHHKVKTAVKADELLEQVEFFLSGTVFPDNFINVVDETLAGAVFDGRDTVSMGHFNGTLSRITGSVILTANNSCA